MAAPLPYTEKIYLTENIFVDIKIYQRNGQPKFSLTLVRDNKRLVCFDNHEGRAPHKHIKNKIYPYEFENVDKLIEDFYIEVARFMKEVER